MTDPCTSWSTDEDFHVPSLLGVPAEWLPPSALTLKPSRTEHCTLLEQHSSCHCTLMDRWWLRPSAKPGGDTEGDWGGVHLTFEMADGCAKETEDIQLIKLRLRWVRRCQIGGVRRSRFLWRGIKFDGGKVPGEQRTREGKSEGDEPFPHKLKQVMDYRSQRVSSGQNVLIMNFRPTGIMLFLS